MMNRNLMTKTNEWLQLCDDIDDGEYDAALDDIAKAVSSRRDIVQRRTARRLQRNLAVDDRVKLTNGIKPRYFEGMTGIVKELRTGAARIHLDKLPTHTGAGRPPEAGFKRDVLVELIYLKKLDEDDDVDTLAGAVDPADIGDDTDDEEDDD